MKTNKISRVEELRVKGGMLRVTASLGAYYGNRYESFSINFHKYNKRCYLVPTEDEKRTAIEQLGLEPVMRVRGCAYNGMDAHALQNAIYFAKKGEIAMFQHILRLTDDEVEQCRYIYNAHALWYWLVFIGNVVSRWKAEANDAIAAIVNGRDLEFESTSDYDLTGLGDIAEDELRVEEERLKNGYYNERRFDCFARTNGVHVLSMFGTRINEVDYTDQVGSTVTAMEYIRDYGIPYGPNTQFLFNYNQILTVSHEGKPRFMEEPVEEWHDVFGMKRIKVCCGWYAYINGEYYYIS